MVKKVISLILTGIVLFSSIPVSPVLANANETDPIILYVANDGTEEFRTFQEVVAKVKEINTTNKTRPIIVNFRAGEYFLDDTIKMDASHSGYENAPVTYQAYNNEKVTFVGGKVISKNNITKVTNENVLNRIIDQNARTKIMVIDYSDFDVEFQPLMDNLKKSRGAPAVYIGETALSPARYPNKTSDNPYVKTLSDDYTGYEYEGDLVKSKITFVDRENRADLWSDGALDNAYVHGFLHYSWMDDMASVKSFDKETKEFDIGWNEFGAYSDNNFYFLNILDEIDMPGESYNDLDNKKIYFYPTDDYQASDVYVSTLEKTMVDASNLNYVTFKGLDFKYTRGMFFSLGGNNLTIDNCEVAHNSTGAISISGTNNTVKNSHVYDNANGGISMYGGDRNSSWDANNLIENNKIHDNANRQSMAYVAAVGAYSMGLVIRNNEIYNSPHLLISIGSVNDITIENNEIHHGVSDGSDMGAIYYEGDLAILGLEIRYNYFHHNGNNYGGDYGQQAIFADNGTITPHVHHNIFYNGLDNGNTAIKANGAQFGLVENNIFAGYKWPTYFQSWGNSQYVQTNWFLPLHSVPTYNGIGTYNKLTTGRDNLFREEFLSRYSVDSFYANAFYDYFNAGHREAMLEIESNSIEEWWKESELAADLLVVVDQVLTPEEAARVRTIHPKQVDQANMTKLGMAMLTKYGAENAQKLYEDAVKELEASVSANLKVYAEEHAPQRSNIFKGNVLVGANIHSNGAAVNDNGTETYTYHDKTGILDSGNSIFIEYANDFTLTDEGLEEVRKTNPAFENILMENIGYKEPKTEEPSSPSQGGGGGGGGGSKPITPSPSPVPSPIPSPLPSPKPPKPLMFTDISANQWFFNSVNYVYQNGLMVGMTDTEFEPNRKATRAMIANILWRLESDDDVALDSLFKDVDKNAWHAKGIAWAKNSGLITGYEDGEFRPNGEITRQELATIIARYLKFKGEQNNINGAAEFLDIDGIAPWAKESCLFLKSNGVMQGREGNIFDPKAQTTRAETAQLLTNLNKLLPRN
ncbi:MAG: S-layer homology domain-containing protein [Clostridiales bacterium]|nr:S-layer homology domain-containing protein [Clostridiales bacterium]